MKAVLFDFNGTLFDDTIFHIWSWGSYLKRRFGIALTEQEVRDICVGPCNRTIFHNLLGGRYSEAEMDMFSREKEAEYRATALASPDQMHLVGGAPELFDLLVARKIPLALATASIWDNILFYLNDLGLNKWFSEDRIVYEDGKCRSKPEPDFYLEAARRINVAPEDCIVVEDSPTGLLAAKNAGIGRIIAIDRTHSREQLAAAAPVYAFIHDFWGFERYL